MAKFDKSFEDFILQRLQPITNCEDFAHAFSYTGGIDIADIEKYEKKIVWVSTVSKFIGSHLRHNYLTDIATLLDIPYECKIEYNPIPFTDTFSKTTKMKSPSSFGKLSWHIVQKLREEYNASD